jgi:hypothetical protein
MESLPICMFSALLSTDLIRISIVLFTTTLYRLTITLTMTLTLPLILTDGNITVYHMNLLSYSILSYPMFAECSLKFPILLAVGLILLLEVLLYAIVRIIVSFYESVATRWFTPSAGRKLFYELSNAKNFDEWSNAARELDRIEGRDKWKHKTYTRDDYDDALIHEWIHTLKQQRAAEDYKSLIHTLQSIFASDNPAGISNDSLYNQTHFGTKQLINDFIAVVLECLVVVRDADQIDLTQRLAFFKRARQSYGRTALLLSGGASLGYFHIVCITLL